MSTRADKWTRGKKQDENYTHERPGLPDILPNENTVQSPLLRMLEQWRKDGSAAGSAEDVDILWEYLREQEEEREEEELEELEERMLEQRKEKIQETTRRKPTKAKLNKK